MTARTEVSDQIKRYKVEAGLSIRQLAEVCGVQKSAVTNWMAGHTRPTIDHLVTMANAFDIHVWEDRVDFYESASRVADKAEL